MAETTLETAPVAVAVALVQVVLVKLETMPAAKAGVVGASYNQPFGTIVNDWEVVSASGGSIISGTEQLIKERAPYSSPTSWTRVSAINTSGGISINGI